MSYLCTVFAENWVFLLQFSQGNVEDKERRAFRQGPGLRGASRRSGNAKRPVALSHAPMLLIAPECLYSQFE
jgi:hypothetical protein